MQWYMHGQQQLALQRWHDSSMLQTAEEPYRKGRTALLNIQVVAQAHTAHFVTLQVQCQDGSGGPGPTTNLVA